MAQLGTGGGEDLGGEDSGVGGSGFADGDGGDGNSGGHLHHGEQGVEAAERSGGDGDGDDGQDGFGGDDPGEMGGATGSGDDDTDAARGGLAAEFAGAGRGAMGGTDVDLVGNVEEVEGAGSLVHDLEVAVTAHEDGDEGLSFHKAFSHLGRGFLQRLRRRWAMSLRYCMPSKLMQCDGLVGAGDGRFQVCGARGHAQHPAASGDDLAIDELGSGVEDLHAGDGVGALNARDGLAGLGRAGVAAGGDDDADDWDRDSSGRCRH